MLSSLILGILGIVSLIFFILTINDNKVSGKSKPKVMSITLLIIAGIFLFGAYANYIQ